MLQEVNIADWAQATNEQHAKRLTEHTALKQTIILEVSAKVKRAKTLVESLGKGELTAWTVSACKSSPALHDCISCMHGESRIEYSVSRHFTLFFVLREYQNKLYASTFYM